MKKIIYLIPLCMILTLIACAEEISAPVAGPPAALGQHFPFSFTAVDLNGNDVTELSLGEKQIYFIHLWATWCPPCIKEMPELAEVAREYADKVGFIGLLADFEENPAGALQITGAADLPASFIMVDANTAGLEDALALVQSGYVPTTVLINGDGALLAEPLIGAYGARYAAVLEGLLSD